MKVVGLKVFCLISGLIERCVMMWGFCCLNDGLVYLFMIFSRLLV